MNCNICLHPTSLLFKKKILHKYDVDYFQCTSCGFIQTQKPYWLEESYSEAISSSDTGIVVRNLFFSTATSILIYFLKLNRTGKFLDFGAGYGLFTRLMRDKGFDFYWYDKHASNLFARGFEGVMVANQYEAITAFENFEHLEDPYKEIKNLSEVTDTIIFSTELIPVSQIEDWWYLCLEHGQHISLYSIESLRIIAQRLNLNFISNGTNLHVFSKRKFSPAIFMIVKIIMRFKFEKWFLLPAKTQSDMDKRILFLQETSK